MCFGWYVKAVSKKYATFDGRANRAEFWCFTLFYLVGNLSLLVIGYVFGPYYGGGETGLMGLLLISIFVLVNVLPSIAVFVRRLHDSGRSGWWYLLNLIPIIGLIAFILFGLAGSQEDNKYGKKIR